MNAARYELFLRTRERALRGERHLMMVRDPTYHGYQLSRMLTNPQAIAALHRARALQKIAVPKATPVRGKRK